LVRERLGEVTGERMEGVFVQGVVVWPDWYVEGQHSGGGGSVGVDVEPEGDLSPCGGAAAAVGCGGGAAVCGGAAVGVRGLSPACPCGA
jgi:hypothetical protein